jgi:predicted GIY-YIG superfamily endonuclease
MLKTISWEVLLWRTLMKIYIYSYINKTNGHRYIGKTNNIERRKREHKSMAYNPRSHIYNTV